MLRHERVKPLLPQLLSPCRRSCRAATPRCSCNRWAQRVSSSTLLAPGRNPRPRNRPRSHPRRPRSRVFAARKCRPVAQAMTAIKRLCRHQMIRAHTTRWELVKRSFAVVQPSTISEPFYVQKVEACASSELNEKARMWNRFVLPLFSQRLRFFQTVTCNQWRVKRV